MGDPEDGYDNAGDLVICAWGKGGICTVSQRKKMAPHLVDGDGWNETFANARLLAAAPKLLQACEIVVSCLRDVPHYKDMLEKYVMPAIADARGERDA